MIEFLRLSQASGIYDDTELKSMFTIAKDNILTNGSVSNNSRVQAIELDDNENQNENGNENNSWTTGWIYWFESKHYIVCLVLAIKLNKNDSGNWSTKYCIDIFSGMKILIVLLTCL